jgi:hypothetical protein
MLALTHGCADVGTAQFLASLNIMDYSLLVGVHDLTRGNKDELRNRGLSVIDVRSVGPSHSWVARLLMAHTLCLQPKALGHSPNNAEMATRKQRKALRKAISQADPVALRDAPQGLPEETREEYAPMRFVCVCGTCALTVVAVAAASGGWTVCFTAMAAASVRPTSRTCLWMKCTIWA